MMAADIIWDYDEARSRTLFKEAIAGLVELLNNQEVVEQPPVRNMMVEGVKNLRREMLKMLAGHDARLAREFLRATRSSPSEQANASHVSPENDLQLEVSLATQIAATDPKQALEIGKESLSQGFSPELMNLIPALQQKDAASAAKLAGEIVIKLRGVNLDSNEEARHMALNLLRAATQSPDETKAGATPALALLESPALRELTEMLAAEALRASSDGGLLSELQAMMPVVEKYAPARAAQLRRKTEKKEASVEVIPTADAMQEWGKYHELTEKGTVDELLGAAAKAPEGMREMLYLEASTKAMKEGNPERARTLINENVKDPHQRQMLLEQLDQMAVVAAAEQGKIEQTRKMLATLRTNEERAMLLAQLAGGAALKGEKKIALQLLEEARGMIGAKAKNMNQLGAQLLVAHGYATLEPTRSLEILEPVVDQVNELLGAAIVLGGFFTEEFIRDDEVMLEPIAMVSVEFFNKYAGDIAALARADFDRTRALVSKFERGEIRIMAQLLIAQSILSPKKT
jgi:hypothetical protein